MEQNKINNKFLNFYFKKGKKSKIINKYNSLLFKIKKLKLKKKPNKILEISIKNLLYKINLKEEFTENNCFFLLNKKKQLNYSINLLYKNFNKLSNISLLKEIINAYNKEGDLIFKKKENYNKIKKFSYLIK